eukprot:scaffold650_cov407-Prasinococcus_capsulatus_cf.AAC.19
MAPEQDHSGRTRVFLTIDGSDTVPNPNHSAVGARAPAAAYSDLWAIPRGLSLPRPGPANRIEQPPQLVAPGIRSEASAAVETATASSREWAPYHMPPLPSCPRRARGGRM